MIERISSLAAAAGLALSIALLPAALSAEDGAQASAPIAAAAPDEEGMGCPGSADGKPCCAGCETRQRISKGKATGGCPCQQRAKEAAEAAEGGR